MRCVSCCDKLNCSKDIFRCAQLLMKMKGVVESCAMKLLALKENRLSFLIAMVHQVLMWYVELFAKTLHYEQHWG